MQTEAIITAALEVRKEEGLDVVPEIMVPLVGHVNELKFVKKTIVETADKLIADSGEDTCFIRCCGLYFRRSWLVRAFGGHCRSRGYCAFDGIWLSACGRCKNAGRSDRLFRYTDRWAISCCRRHCCGDMLCIPVRLVFQEQAQIEVRGKR